MNHKPNAQNRGFVMLVVLAAGVVVAAVVATQFISSGQSQLIGIRASEEVRARAIAEACLAMASATVDGFEPDGGVGADYDRILLGADMAIGGGDDFVPFATRVVSIPKDGAGNPLNQWELVDIGDGVCALRFDDNSDDGRTALPNTSGPPQDDGDEGPSVDPNPYKDRDRSIFVTAIGLFPALPGVADADLYDRAHARVTLKRALQRVNIYQPLAPAVWAGDIDLNSNVNICGLGGINSNGDLNASSNTCICGQTDANSFSGPDPPVTGDTCSGCPAAASPQCIPATVPATPVTVTPPSWVHWASPGNQRDREGWSSPLEVPINVQGIPPVPDHGQGSPDAVPANDGSIVGGADPAPFCAFYADRAQAAVFVWDGADADTRQTLQVTLGGGALGPGATNIPDDDCRAGGGLDTLDPIPPPCVWDWWSVPNAIDCSNGGTPCWKLQTINMGFSDAEIGIGPITAYETTDSSDDWSPHKNVDLPHVTPGRTFGTGVNRLCGDTANNCANCRTTGLAADDNADPAIEENGHWHFEDGMNNEMMPSPSVWIFNGAGQKIHLNSSYGSASGPWRATLLTNTFFDIDSGGELCCATCDCATAAGISGGTCGKNDVFGQLDAAVQTLTDDTAPADQVFDGAPGYALKSNGDLDLPGNIIIVGDVRAGSVDVTGNACIVGNVVGYATAASSECNSGGTCNDAYVCTGSNVVINGDVHSMMGIDGASNSHIYGNLVAKDNICLNSNASIDGAVMAVNEVELNSNVTIVSTATSVTGQIRAANVAVTTYMEASW